MKSEFRHKDYLQHNPDLADRYTEDDDVALFEHFKRFGRYEMRGMQAKEYFRVEGVLISDQGHLFIVGWADRRMASGFSLSLNVGFTTTVIDEDQVHWYRREDVGALTGDVEASHGFVVLTKIEDLITHSYLSIQVAGVTCFEEQCTWYLSKERFLTEALSACCVLADRPVGEVMHCADELLPYFQQLWHEVCQTRIFTLAYENRREDDTVLKSIVIVLHRKSDMLLVQLSLLAPYLEYNPVEVVIVCNEMVAVEQLVTALSGFTQLHNINLRLFICSGNAGFSLANNFGVEKSRGEIVMLMNPDIFPQEGREDKAWRFFDEDPGDGLHGALLYYGDGSLMHSGMYTTSDLVIDPVTGRTISMLRVEHFGKGLAHHINDPLPDQVLSCNSFKGLMNSGALWKIKKHIYQDLGGLPLDYIYAYYEDADFCLELLNKGYPIKIEIGARFVHLEGVGGQKPPFMRTAMWLNRHAYSKKFRDNPFVETSQFDRTML